MSTTTPIRDLPPRRSAWRIFAPAIVIGFMLIAYAVYWYVVGHKIRNEFTSWAVHSAEQDVTGTWRDLSLGGFPYRIQLDFDTPRFTAPRTPEEWSWTADAAEVDFLPYDLRHLVLKVDGRQNFSYRDVSDGSRHMLGIVTQDAWASYVMLDDMPLGRVAIDIRDMIAKLDEDESGASAFVLAATRLQLHARPSSEAEDAPPALPGSYDFALQGDNVVFDMSTPPLFGPHIEQASLQARLSHMPLSEGASMVEFLDTWRARGGEMEISSLQLKWGALDMQASGRLSLDAQNRLQGNLMADIADYQGLIQALADARVVDERGADLARAGAGLFSQFQGAVPGGVRLPVRIKDGQIYLGPLPIGELQPLY